MGMCTGFLEGRAEATIHIPSSIREKGYVFLQEHRDMMKNNVEEDYNPHEIKTLKIQI